MKKHNIHNFTGVFSKDMLPSVMAKSSSCIINIENYFEGNGTHWVCVYNDPKSKDVEYFDSFGLSPPDLIRHFLETTDKGIVYNDVDIQHINSMMCGYYCCYYVIKRYARVKPLDILLEFDQGPSTDNERAIREIAHRLLSQ